jgi:hypothetical protein
MHSKDSLTRKAEFAQLKLTRVLVIKGVCELLFVVMLVSIAAYTMVGAKLDGDFQVIVIDNKRAIVGRIGRYAGDAEIEVHVFVNNQFAGHTVVRCDDNETANVNHLCQFQITLPEFTRGKYEARVFAAPIGAGEVKPFMRLLDAPRVFVVEGIG